jgi:uncharacterized protein (TIGR02246 family)
MLLTITIPAFAAAPDTTSYALSATDRAQIEQIQRDFVTHWGAGDAAACAARFADDGMRVGSRGDVAHGRAEIQQAYAKLLGGPFKGGKVSAGPARIRALGPDYALCEGSFSVTPVRGMPVEGFTVEVLKKTGGRWWVLESHPKIYPVF